MTRELDALVAERVLGWECVRWMGPPWNYYGQEPGRDNTNYDVPTYSADHEAAFEAELEMAEDDALLERYTNALIKLVSNNTAHILSSAIICDWINDFDGHTVAYKLAHATAEQRCVAMCLAVGVSQNEIDAAMEQEVNA